MSAPRMPLLALTECIASAAARLHLPLHLATRDSALESLPFSGPVLLCLQEPGLLALLPLGAAPREALRSAFAFADDFDTFPSFQRQWRWSAKLAVQLETLLQQLAASRLESGPVGVAHVYLNGAFERKYYPAPLATPAPAAADGADNCRAPTPLLQAIELVFGVDSLQNADLGPAPDQASYFRYSPRWNIVGIGRGNTEQQMRRGAIFEFAERWAASMRPANTLTGRQDRLGTAALRPEQLLGMPLGSVADQFPGFSPDRHCDWLPARRISKDGEHSCLVPLALVNYLLPSEPPMAVQRNSNGCALGNSPEEAALFGALEVIERDALLLAWYSRSTPPRLDLDVLPHPASQAVLQLLQLRGYQVACFDITTEFAVPCVLVVLAGQGESRLGAFVTAACHPNPVHALHTALAEALSLLPTAERNHHRSQGVPAAGHTAQYQRYADPAQRRHFDHLLGAPVSMTVAAFVARQPYDNPSPQQAYRQLYRHLAQLGYELIVCDNTPPQLAALGLHSARAYIPGTLYLSFGETPPHTLPQRYAAAARALHWLPEGSLPTHLPPHPLG